MRIGFITLLLLLLGVMLRVIADTEWDMVEKSEDLPDTTVNLNEVFITGDRLWQMGIGNHTVSIDTVQYFFQQSGSLSEVLQNGSVVFIRSYGLGGLATVSLRGTASTQAAILWNGINLQSPMNGIYDMSLIPSFFLDDVRVQHGSSGALFGSGAMGGSIHLLNKAHFNERLCVGYAASYGSFSKWMQGGTIGWGSNRWYTYTRGFYHTAENNFRFRNLAEYGKPLQRLSNAAIEQYGILHEQGVNLSHNNSKKSVLTCRLWRQWNDREIPPAMTVRESRQQQIDGIWRAAVTYEYATSYWETVFRNAYFHEYIVFRDPLVSLHDSYVAHSLISEWENKMRLGSRHLLLAGVNYMFHRAISNNYIGGRPIMHRGALFFSYRYVSLSQKIRVVAGIREEMVNRQLTPFTPSLASEYQLVQWICLKTSISANFRVPTFNDWYWRLGGNPSLKPEKGWSHELGFVVEKKSAYVLLRAVFTGFSNIINNRIVWLPNDIGIWTPDNIERVWSRGVEVGTSAQFQQKNFCLRAMVDYQLVKATNAKDMINSSQAGKQLIYTPLHRCLLQFIAGYKTTTLHYLHQFNGAMYYTADNKKSIPFYHVANLIISQQVFVKQFSCKVYLKANNLFNSSYQVIIWRPMPPFHVEAGMQFFINHKSSKT